MNVDFITAIKMYFANYANFKGRSTRAEFWWAMLFVFLVSLVCKFIAINALASLVSLALLIPNLAVLTRRFHDINKSGWWVLIIWVIEVIGALLVFMALGKALLNAEVDPEGMVAAVQEHMGMVSSGYIIIIAAAIWQIVWCCKPSQPDNQYGVNPYGEDTDAAA